LHSFSALQNITILFLFLEIVYAANPNVLDSFKVLVSSLFSPNGLCVEVPETQINAFCGLMGSGVGFVSNTLFINQNVTKIKIFIERRRLYILLYKLIQKGKHG